MVFDLVSLGSHNGSVICANEKHEKHILRPKGALAKRMLNSLNLTFAGAIFRLYWYAPA